MAMEQLRGRQDFEACQPISDHLATDDNIVFAVGVHQFEFQVDGREGAWIERSGMNDGEQILLQYEVIIGQFRLVRPTIATLRRFDTGQRTRVCLRTQDVELNYTNNGKNIVRSGIQRSKERIKTRIHHPTQSGSHT